jgi:deoxycytidylate deaminase
MKTNLAIVEDRSGGLSKGTFDDQRTITRSLTPEIVIALCGPLGTPLHEVANAFKSLLISADYRYEQVDVIKLSEEIRAFCGLPHTATIEHLINAGNNLRKDHGNAVLARIAIQKITVARQRMQPPSHVDHQHLSSSEAEAAQQAVVPTVSGRTCHIIDSVKNIDELRLLRSVYGDMLHVVGVYAPIEIRINRLAKRLGSATEVHKLIDRDSGEEIEHGQRVEETFPLSDFFLRADTDTDSQLTSRVKRFLDLILGTRIVTPTANERAMYAAFSASRNSACLSRQVGAAITDRDGEILATGWNDVPKPFGGLYQAEALGSSQESDHRCWNKDGGKCFNDEEKTAIANAVIGRFVSAGVLDESKKESAFNLMRHDSQLKSLIEFSRAVHAEMHALLSAGSTSGHRVKGGRLFVTTYPCHSCARHLVAAGIAEVFFLEPYRKSLATKLHADAITELETDQSKVRIVPFDGVAPSRFLKLFSATESGRKEPKTGKMKARQAHPVTAITLEAIPTLEAFAVRTLESTGLLKKTTKDVDDSKN